jgi:hypothetical protein
MEVSSSIVHQALSAGSSYDEISPLILTHPHDSSVKDENGDLLTPIHLAIEIKAGYTGITPALPGCCQDYEQ